MQTAPETVDIRRLRVARALRRVFAVVLTLFILAALFGFLGVRSTTKHAAADDWSLDFTYPTITRAGLAVPLVWEISHEGGFGGEDATVVVRIKDRYMDLFDENGFDPSPSSEWSDGEYVYWEFDAPPDGDTMRISADTRTGSAVQFTTRRADTAVMVEDEAVVAIGFKTRVMP